MLFRSLSGYAPSSVKDIQGGNEMAWRKLAQLITAIENAQVATNGKAADPALNKLVEAVRKEALNHKVPVLGITGTGGAGKSSLTDELIRRMRLDQGDALRIAVISIDPSRRKSGGALLGDRIRMNAISPWSAGKSNAKDKTDSGQRVFMRSLATRDFGSEISAALPDVLAATKIGRAHV